MAWVERLRAARCIATYRLAYYLLFQDWKTRGKPIKLPNIVLAELGIGDREGKWRALRELERLGLVSVEYQPRKSPVVTVRNV
jgi:hypothetical protein